ncbi:MAG: cytochrome c biogenesis protein ResB [Deltaproteobacteria bacterium]|nr:cytochrome c biogenesis protein ResB [Deltaproteobacteria bacterium]
MWRRYLPHVMHAAFLIVVSGHLVSSVSGDRVRLIPDFEGGLSQVAGTPYSLRINGVDLKMSDRGYPVEFFADITLFKGVEAVSGGRVRGNHPIVNDGYGIYIKNGGMKGRGRRYVFFIANRDDEAKVVLAGAVLFTLANILYVLPHRRNDAGGEGEVSWKG